MRIVSVIAVALLISACADPFRGGATTGSIRGTVIDDAGAGVANAGLVLSRNAFITRTVTSGPGGIYTFADVPAGTYELAITPPGGFATGAASSTSVTIDGGIETSPSAFVLERISGGNGTIRGVVIDNSLAPAASVSIVLTGDTIAPRIATSDCNGVYTFVDVPPGVYSVRAGNSKDAAATAAISVSVTGGTQANATVLAVDRGGGESAFVAAIRAKLAASSSDDSFAGAVLVSHNDQLVFAAACGLADREQRIPNTMDTKFRVGSMNKMLTAVAVLQLVQGGKVQLGAPFGEYLKDYPNAEMASKVTVHHLLTHTGGTGDIFGPLFNTNRLSLRDADDYLQLYGARALQFEPGAQMAYSNYGFVLLGAIIEKVSGMSYDDYVAAHILAPAGMVATGAAPEDSVVVDRSIGYTKSGGLGPWLSNAPVLPYRGSPAGGWYSTVGDLGRFASALLNYELLDPSHTALLMEGKVAMGPFVKYAYGFIDRQQVGLRLVGHGGGFPGMNGELTFQPTGGYVIVVLSNLDPPAATMIEAFILANLPPPS